jgi:hypothetical protein
MRGFLIGLSVSLAFIVGCVAGSTKLAAPDVHAASPSGAVVEQRWAYFCFEAEDADTVTFKANAAGARGWEMIAAAQRSTSEGRAVWCFRQPRP